MSIESFLKILNDGERYCPSCGESLTLGECLDCLKEIAFDEEDDV